MNVSGRCYINNSALDPLWNYCFTSSQAQVCLPHFAQGLYNRTKDLSFLFYCLLQGLLKVFHSYHIFILTLAFGVQLKSTGDINRGFHFQ